MGLLKKYEEGKATAQEVEELEAWYALFESKADPMEDLKEGAKAEMRERMLMRISKEIPQSSEIVPITKKTIPMWQRWSVAASLLIVVSVGAYVAFRKPVADTAFTSTLKEDFKPGGNRAILTLAGGKQIVLTGAKNGQLAMQGNTTIQKTGDGEVVYQSGEGVPLINTMTTPRGGQYHLTLADGTGVWLNAASSITYPTTFNDEKREVTTTGEVYFEVAKAYTSVRGQKTRQSFRVKTKNQTVDVLGTHFNINNYDDESAIKTTLIEGSIRLNGKLILKPGEEAAIAKTGIVSVSNVDTEEITAWKEGYFQFNDADIETIMRQISRWYDVDVAFNGPVSKERFTGRISRFRNISNVLKIVQAYKDVNITFDGRRIMVN